MNQGSILRRTVAEGLGTGALLTIVVGSGIMGERLAGGSTGLALLANSLATGLGLSVLILGLEPVSGAHFNPVVTLTAAWRRSIAWRDAGWYVAAQSAGAVLGVGVADAMFGLPVYSVSQHVRSGAGQALGELVATFGLLGVIRLVGGSRPAAVPYAVGAYIASAYWFTSSTSFANPAVTVARCLTDTFAGIRPEDAPGFFAAQLVGAFLAMLVFDRLTGRPKSARG